MIPRPRVPRVRRSTLVLLFAVAAFAFPLGVLANHQFNDVATGSSIHDDVEALVNAGVTSGCGGGNYCPSQNVTRGQMAQFLNRLGDLDGDSAPSVNADMVDDIHAVDLMPGGNPPAGMTIRGNWGLNGDADELTWGTFSFGYELSIAPTEHYLVAGAPATADCPGSATNPEAAFGHLCVYESAANISGNPGFDCIFSTSNSCGTANRTGFGISQIAAAQWTAGGTWAVTEPLILVIPLSEEDQVGDGRNAFGPTD